MDAGTGSFMKRMKIARSMGIGVALLSGLVLMNGCGDGVKRTRKNGVEIVHNRISPAKGGKGLHFNKPEILIDTECRELFDKGFGRAGEFIVDGDGNLHVVSYKSDKDFIYKLDSRGRFLASYGRKGQGPGELQAPGFPTVHGNEIGITDISNKFVVFDIHGRFLYEKVFDKSITSVDFLPGGNFLVFWAKKSIRTPKYSVLTLSIFDRDFREIREIEDYKLYYMDDRYPPFFMWRVNADGIYVINEERGYEIAVYGMDGVLKKRIRKDFRGVSADDEILEGMLGPKFREIRRLSPRYVPDPLPPIRSFLVDGKGNLLVMTYERDRAIGNGFVYDIFDATGAFIDRQTFPIPWAGYFWGPKREFLSQDSIVYYRETSDGGEELVRQAISRK